MRRGCGLPGPSRAVFPRSFAGLAPAGDKGKRNEFKRKAGFNGNPEPDGVRNGHIGEIINRFERAGLKIERMELGMVTPEQAKANYAEHEGKPFYEGLISYITSGPVVKMVISGEGAVAKCRSLMGATNPAEAAPGTIRGDFGLIMDENVIHGSDSPESAEREIGVFFPAE